MNQNRMTDGERKLLRYAKDILNGPSDPLISENIAKVYRNLLLRSRAHEIDEVQKNIDFLEGIDKGTDSSSEAQEKSSDGVIIAFYALLAHDQLAALSLVHRAEDNNLLRILIEALKALQGAQVTLYELWKNVTAKLSDTTLQASTMEWIGLTAAYCRSMLPTNPLAAFSIWLQACEWNQRFPSLEASVVLTELAYVVMTPNDKSLYRINNALWAFVQDQEEAHSLSNELGQAARLSSLFASLEMTRAEIAKPETDESAIREIWEISAPWMTADLPSHPAWSAFETTVLNVFKAKPLVSLSHVESQLNLVSQNWMEQHSMEAKESIQLNKSPSAWADRPLYSASWTEIEEEAEMRNVLWPLALPGRILDGKSSMIDRVRFLTPSFYPDQILIEVQVQLEDNARAICSVLTSNSRQTAVLTGQSPTIHALNARGLLKRMNEEGVALDYLRFFCAAVWGEAGPFRIVENIEDIPLSDSPNEETLETLQRFVREQSYEVRYLPDGNWVVTVLVCYQNVLFQTQFKVMPNGMVEMVSDQPLEQDLPVRRIVMRDGFRLYEGIWGNTLSETEQRRTDL